MTAAIERSARSAPASGSWRATALAGMGWWGIELEPVANVARADGARVISAAGSRVRVYVIPTDEEAMIARHTREALQD